MSSHRWYPNTVQWWIIWATVLTAAHFWLDLRLWDLIDRYGAWGLPGYLYPAYTHHREKLAFMVVVVGGLLLWQTSGNKKPRS